MISEISEKKSGHASSHTVEKARAARLIKPGVFSLEDYSIPEPQGGQVRVKLEGCGLCASSIPVWEGRAWFTYPLEVGAPGHEAWGVVDKTGNGVKDIVAGDRVAMLSYHGFASYDVADASAVVRLPDTLQNMPFPGEPLGCAMNIFERSKIENGQTVAILGIGFLGALLIQLAKAAGATVIAISARGYSLEIAKEQGADFCLPMDDHYKIIEKVKELTKGEFCDRVIEATGKEWPLNLAGELTKIRGRLVIAGFHQDGMRSVNIQLWNWRGLDVINAHEREEAKYVDGMRNAVAAVEAGRMNPLPLFTHTFSLEEISSAFDLMIKRPEGFVKAMIQYDW